ncbi:hypothetical protein AXF42_Ash006271 [Apostasia shenzhenica]|uniref:Uncharacterized protein n=1 Tax=Apostasia shenzhenica TaxID=1088818 RepID=A0A2I0AYK1_9ASPA|nr:hypothetical protein AXF42_Ash006271 [Apostasia shenzhenica]
MIVEGVVNRKSVCILIDTSSTHNFVDPCTAKATQCVVEEIARMKVMLATGMQYDVTQVVKGIQWKLQGYKFQADMMILPLGSYDVALGVWWLTMLGPISGTFRKCR